MRVWWKHEPPVMFAASLAAAGGSLLHSGLWPVGLLLAVAGPAGALWMLRTTCRPARLRRFAVHPHTQVMLTCCGLQLPAVLATQPGHECDPQQRELHGIYGATLASQARSGQDAGGGAG